jgi:hypothetical protein
MQAPAHLQKTTRKGDEPMRATRKKDLLPAPPPPAEVSGSDRAALTSAYKAGAILAWKRDAERGYRLTLAGRAEEYVEVAKLTSYLQKLKGAA